MVLLLTVSASAAAEGQGADPCTDWREKASETMVRVAGAQSKTEEAIPVLLDLIKRLNARDAAAPKAFELQRKRAEQTVEDGVTASRLAGHEAKRLRQLLNDGGVRCTEAELYGIKWAQWWFENHGPIVMMRAAYLAAATLDFKRAESIFEEMIALARNSDNPNYAGLLDRATRSLEKVKAGKVPYIPPSRRYEKRENPGKVPPPVYVPKPGGSSQ